MTKRIFIKLAMLLSATVILQSTIFTVNSEAATVTLPETGQTLCYDPAGTVISCSGTGQDGALRKGASWPSPRFSNHGNGTVTDNLTGLVWLTNSNCTETAGGVVRTYGDLPWQDALAWSNALASGLCGLSDNSRSGDWRLPNRTELESLTDLSRSAPALPSGHPFTNVQYNVEWSPYWTSSTYEDVEGGPNNAWYVDFYDGRLSSTSKVNYANVWPIRVRVFADLQLGSNSLAFGSVYVGSSSTKTITLTNRGSGLLSVSAMNFVPLNWFSLDPGTCLSETPSLDPDQSCTINITCTPTSDASVSSTLSIPSNSVGGTERVSLSCTGIIPPSFTVTAEQTTGNGTVTPPSQSVYLGGTAEVVVIPEACYEPVISTTCPQASTNGNYYYFSPITSACNVSVSFPRLTYIISPSYGANGRIIPYTKQAVNCGDTMQFTITPSTGYRVELPVGGTCSQGTLNGNLYTTGMITTDCTVIPTFTRIVNYTVTSIATPTEWGSITPASISIAGGSTTTFTVLPKAGYTETVSGCNGTYNSATKIFTTGTIIGVCEVTASFTRNSYTVTASATPQAGGSITPGSSQVNHGETTTFAIATNTGYTPSVTGCGGSLSQDKMTYTTGTITGVCEVTASFTRNSYTVTASATPQAGGSITPGSSQVNHGETTTFTIATNTDYTPSVTGCGGSLSQDKMTYTTGPITGACEVTASFTRKSYAVTTSATPQAGGSIAPGSRQVNHGETTTFTVSLNNGFIAIVSGCNGTYDSTTRVFSTGAITEPCAVNAFFLFPHIDLDPSTVTDQSQYIVNGTVSDANLPVMIQISCDGVPCATTESTDGTFSSVITLSAEKAYQLTISATDKDGMQLPQQNRTVVYSLIKLADAQRAYRIAQGFINPDAEDLLRLDVAPLNTDGTPKGNGRIDLFDVLSLLSKSIGLGY